jgi:UDP-N-acetylglucosamine 1-carboxyvinyltransferase
VTSVHNVEHIDRGYPEFVSDLRALGAEITRRSA